MKLGGKYRGQRNAWFKVLGGSRLLVAGRLPQPAVRTSGLGSETAKVGAQLQRPIGTVEKSVEVRLNPNGGLLRAPRFQRSGSIMRKEQRT